jgi:hypothetical protein
VIVAIPPAQSDSIDSSSLQVQTRDSCSTINDHFQSISSLYPVSADMAEDHWFGGASVFT